MGLFGSSEPRMNPKQLRQQRSDLEERLQQLRQSDAAMTSDLEQERSGAQRWEHMLVDNLTDDDLARFGLLGWELVGLVSYAVGLGVGGIAVKDVHLRYAFKRPYFEDTAAAADLRRRIAEVRTEATAARLELEQIERRLGY